MTTTSRTYYHYTQDISTDIETGYVLGLSSLVDKHYKPKDGERVQPIVSTDAKGVYYIEAPMYYYAPTKKSAVALVVENQLLQARYKMEQLEYMLSIINRP